MLELIKHMGLRKNIDQDMNYESAILKVKGVMIWIGLIQILIVYEMVSLMLFGLSYWFPETTNDTRRRGGRLFWNICIYMTQLNNVEYRITGDSLTSESAILISNHQSLVDYMAINYLPVLFDSKVEFPTMNFFTWFLIWRIPTLRILFNIAKTDENWELDSNLCNGFFNKLLMSKKNEWVVLFPEVNIFTQECCKLQQFQSQRYYLPVFNHVLYPRFSSFWNVISVVDSNPYKFNKLYDLTIHYYKIINDNEKVFISPDLLEIFASKDKIHINIDVKFKNIKRVPITRPKLEKWLEKTWIEKDDILDRIYTS